MELSAWRNRKSREDEGGKKMGHNLPEKLERAAYLA